MLYRGAGQLTSRSGLPVQKFFLNRAERSTSEIIFNRRCSGDVPWHKMPAVIYDTKNATLADRSEKSLKIRSIWCQVTFACPVCFTALVWNHCSAATTLWHEKVGSSGLKWCCSLLLIKSHSYCAPCGENLSTNWRKKDYTFSKR